MRTFRLRQETGWEPDWDEFEKAVTKNTRLLYLSNPNNPTGAVLPDAAMQRIVERCDATGTWLLSDEVYLGAEISRPRTKSFWGMSDRVIVASGLSKAYGIPGVRIGWIVAPEALAAQCWTQHDCLTIGQARLHTSPSGYQTPPSPGPHSEEPAFQVVCANRMRILR